MWTNRRREAVGDLESLCTTLEKLVHVPSDVEIRSRARLQAHQLAGVFGIFGFSEPKDRMARIDIDLADPLIPVEIVLVSVRKILTSLP